MITTNHVRENFRSGKVSVGCQLRTRSGLIAELYGLIGFDFVFIEGEHFPYTNESLQEIVCACENRNIEPFFRLNNKDASHIMQCLDIGVKGLFCPHVDSGIEAQEIVKAGKFPPQGSRGYSNTSRATNFGYLSMDEYKRLANENTMLFAFIESKTAIDNIRDIIDSGIDGLHLGPGDLSESLGCPVNSSLVQSQIDAVFKIANQARIPVAIPAATVDEAKDYISRGANIISFSSDLALLKATCEHAIREIKTL
jgi:2-keto-3-deoxy-L-rhamnonate aldolase RhmA